MYRHSWSRGEARGQRISSHAIDPILPKDSKGVTSGPKTTKITLLIVLCYIKEFSVLQYSVILEVYAAGTKGIAWG